MYNENLDIAIQNEKTWKIDILFTDWTCNGNKWAIHSSNF